MNTAGKKIALSMLCVLLAGATVHAQESPDVRWLTLVPGDSRSLELEFDGHRDELQMQFLVLFGALIFDAETHQLTVSCWFRGDQGPEFTYRTSGLILTIGGGLLGLVDVLEPRTTYSYDSVSYFAEINPPVSLGGIAISLDEHFDSFDPPYFMTCTVTLSQ